MTQPSTLSPRNSRRSLCSGAKLRWVSARCSNWGCAKTCPSCLHSALLPLVVTARIEFQIQTDVAGQRNLDIIARAQYQAFAIFGNVDFIGLDRRDAINVRALAERNADVARTGFLHVRIVGDH